MRYLTTTSIIRVFLFIALTLGVFALNPALTQEETTEHPLGEPRDDLERFYGIYGDSDNPGRGFFVAEAELPPGSERELPPGYLMIGAMWGDVAPWYMKSVAETEFEQQWVSQFQSEPLVVEFYLDEDGNAVALDFKTLFADLGRLERLDDLPEEWQ